MCCIATVCVSPLHFSPVEMLWTALKGHMTWGPVGQAMYAVYIIKYVVRYLLSTDCS